MARLLLHVLGWWFTLGCATLFWITLWEKNSEGAWATAGQLLRQAIQWIFGGP